MLKTLERFRTQAGLALALHRSGEMEPDKDADQLAAVVERMPFVIDIAEALVSENAALLRELERAYNGD